jgi:hypothetical protein
LEIQADREKSAQSANQRAETQKWIARAQRTLSMKNASIRMNGRRVLPKLKSTTKAKILSTIRIQRSAAWQTQEKSMQAEKQKE